VSTTIAPSTPATLREDRNVRALQVGLARAGWELRALDIDLTTGRARIEVTDDGGRLLTFDADRHDRASLTVEAREMRRATVGRRGDRCVVDRLETKLLWRHHYEGVRSGLRNFCNYLEDNAPNAGLLARYDVRRLMVAAAGTA
jgi:hypothetical protein